MIHPIIITATGKAECESSVARLTKISYDLRGEYNLTIRGNGTTILIDENGVRIK